MSDSLRLFDLNAGNLKINVRIIYYFLTTGNKHYIPCNHASNIYILVLKGSRKSLTWTT